MRISESGIRRVSLGFYAYLEFIRTFSAISNKLFVIPYAYYLGARDINCSREPINRLHEVVIAPHHSELQVLPLSHAYRECNVV